MLKISIKEGIKSSEDACYWKVKARWNVQARNVQLPGSLGLLDGTILRYLSVASWDWAFKISLISGVEMAGFSCCSAISTICLMCPCRKMSWDRLMEEDESTKQTDRNWPLSSQLFLPSSWQWPVPWQTSLSEHRQSGSREINLKYSSWEHATSTVQYLNEVHSHTSWATQRWDQCMQVYKSSVIFKQTFHNSTWSKFTASDQSLKAYKAKEHSITRIQALHKTQNSEPV